MATLVRSFQLVEDRLQGRIDQQLGGFQVLMKGLLLLMKSLPVGFGGAVAFALERFELLLQARLIRLQGSIGRECGFVGLFQLGFLGCRQDGIMMMMPSSSRAGRGRGSGCSGVYRLSESRRDTCGSKRKGQEGDSWEG